MSSVKELKRKHERTIKFLYFLWKSIDFESMSASRRIGLWDEFQAKVEFACRQDEPERMLEVFGKKFGIVSFKKTQILSFIDEKVLQDVRENPRLVVLMLRNIIEVERARFNIAKETRDKNDQMRRFADELDKDWAEFLEEIKRVQKDEEEENND